MTSVERACKTISNLVRTAPIESAGLLGLEEGGGSINVQGEEQKTLDIVTNDVLKRALRFTGKMGVIASEEEDTPVDVLDDEGLGTYRDPDGRGALMDETGKYTAVFDPLDGSSNVDAGIPTGTIFGIYEEPEGCEIDANGDGVVSDKEMRDCLGATLQAGNKLVVSGYCLYSAATSFVMSFGGKEFINLRLENGWVRVVVLNKGDFLFPVLCLIPFGQHELVAFGPLHLVAR